jgi:hypothetical protein
MASFVMIVPTDARKQAIPRGTGAFSLRIGRTPPAVGNRRALVGAPRDPARIAALLAGAALRIARATAARVDLRAHTRVSQRRRVVTVRQPVADGVHLAAIARAPGRVGLAHGARRREALPLRAASVGSLEATDLT